MRHDKRHFNTKRPVMMNRRFLRWVLDVAHKAEKRNYRYGTRIYSLSDWAIRWNGLMCCVIFSLIFLVLLFTDDAQCPFLSTIGFGGVVIGIWFLTLNAWFFHRMRRKKMIKKARQRIRWITCSTQSIPHFSLKFTSVQVPKSNIFISC